MSGIMRKLALAAIFSLLLGAASWAQTSSIEGDVKGPDGQPLRGAQIKIERQDIRGNYKVKTDKKGHYFHAGLPLGTYRIILEVDGKLADQVNNVRTRLGDPTVVNFDLEAVRKRQEAMQRAAETGTLTDEQMRGLTAEQKEQLERQMKERQQSLAKNKALNDAFNAGMTAMQAKQFDAAVESFVKAGEIDAKQHVVWANLAESYMGLATTKAGPEQEATMAKGLEAYGKALELKPDDAAYHNNFALALAKAKKIEEAKEELNKAAQLNPPGAGQYFYNLGAVLVNTGQLDAAGDAFKRAIEADPNYADAQYQYGVFLISKATTTPEGKIVPPPGTKEAFEKYLQLKPDGPFADAAKGMLASMEITILTEYTDPDAAKQKKAKKK